jgi:hypothetical protein
MVLDSYSCELCLRQRVETARHLFLHCSFAKNCWAMIRVLVPSWLRAERATAYIKHYINKPFTMEIIIIMSWCIWKELNGWLFNNKDPSVQHCWSSFKTEFAPVIRRVKGQRAILMSQWLESLS